MVFDRRSLMLALMGVFLCSREAGAGIFRFGKKTEIHLSPEVNGIVTLEGVPLGEMLIYRTLDYDKEYRDETTTDEQGRFHFPAKVVKSRRPGNLLDETRVRQVIGLTFQEQTHLLWYHTPSGITERSSVSRRLGDMQCELTTPEKEVLFHNIDKPEFPLSAFSICRWDDGLELSDLPE